MDMQAYSVNDMESVFDKIMLEIPIDDKVFIGIAYSSYKRKVGKYPYGKIKYFSYYQISWRPINKQQPSFINTKYKSSTSAHKRMMQIVKAISNQPNLTFQ